MTGEDSSGGFRVARSLVAVWATLLAACATPDQLPRGTSEADVIARFGQPDRVYPSRGASEPRRLEYAIGPHQQFAWMIDLDADQRLLKVEQTRTFEAFGRVRIGVDTFDDVRREFGAPWKVEGYSALRLTGWLYPYKEAGVWNSMMAVMFDKSGVVRRTENGPDPRFLGGRDNQRN